MARKARKQPLTPEFLDFLESVRLSVLRQTIYTERGRYWEGRFVGSPDLTKQGPHTREEGEHMMRRRKAGLKAAANFRAGLFGKWSFGPSGRRRRSAKVRKRRFWDYAGAFVIHRSGSGGIVRKSSHLVKEESFTPPYKSRLEGTTDWLEYAADALFTRRRYFMGEKRQRGPR